MNFMMTLLGLTIMMFAGSVKIISRKRIEMLDASLGDTSRVLSHWGMGAGELMGKDDVSSS